MLLEQVPWDTLLQKPFKNRGTLLKYLKKCDVFWRPSHISTEPKEPARILTTEYFSVRFDTVPAGLRYATNSVAFESGQRRCFERSNGSPNWVFLLFASYFRQVSLYYIKVTTALPQYVTDHLAYIISTLSDSTFRTGRLNVRVHVFDVGSDSQVTVHIVHVLGGASGLCVRMLRGLMTLILTTTFLEPFGCVVTVSSPWATCLCSSRYTGTSESHSVAKYKPPC
jgi:hypothetical protein